MTSTVALPRSPLSRFPLAWVGALTLLGLSGFSHCLLAQPRCPGSPIAPTPVVGLYPQGGTSLAQGEGICWNDRYWPIPWVQWSEGRSQRIGVADWGLVQMTGATWGNSSQWQTQPLQWFAPPGVFLEVTVQLSSQHRYLALDPLVEMLGAKTQVEGGLLRIQTPKAQITQVGGDGTTGQLSLSFDRPTAWTWEEGNSASPPVLRVQADLDPRQYPPDPADRLPLEKRIWNRVPGLAVEFTPSAGEVWFKFPLGTPAPQMEPGLNPPQLTIKPGSSYPSDRTVAWGPGITWQQRTLGAGNARFPAQILALDLPIAGSSGLTLRPLWIGQGFPGSSLKGLAPLGDLARQTGALAALNGTYFNRNTQLPLGMIRDRGVWVSGPILDRGVMAWNDQGQVAFGRATLAESVQLNPTAPTPGPSFPVVALNSGYVKAGLARYTALWGSAYTPLTDNETAILVASTPQPGTPGGTLDRVQGIQRLGKAQTGTMAIPPQGYLLVARSYQTAANQFAPGQILRLSQSLTPPELASYPQGIGGGPLLMVQGRSVLNGAAEQFSPAFLSQAAYRTVVARNTQGQLLWITVQPQPQGNGPTLSQLLTVLPSLAITDALNLDGGSSTSLYLGGRLINRDPANTARVHNGLGLFWLPAPLLGN